MSLIKKINIPKYQRKRTTLGGNLTYDELEIYQDSVIGLLNGQQAMTWYFEDYCGVDFINANMNSQFAQIVFLTGINSNNRVIGPDLFATQNASAMKDTNRILFCSGMFSFSKTNDFAKEIASEIKDAYSNFKINSKKNAESSSISNADEIRKLKSLLDDEIITLEEFEIKKRQLLGL